MEEALDETPFYAGDTRPAMARHIGLPLTTVGGLFIAFGMIINLLGNWRLKLIGVFLLLCLAVGLWAVLRHDHNVLRVAARYLNTKFGCLDSTHWSGATLEALPVNDKTPRGFYDG